MLILVRAQIDRSIHNASRAGKIEVVPGDIVVLAEIERLRVVVKSKIARRHIGKERFIGVVLVIAGVGRIGVRPLGIVGKRIESVRPVGIDSADNDRIHNIARSFVNVKFTKVINDRAVDQISGTAVDKDARPLKILSRQAINERRIPGRHNSAAAAVRSAIATKDGVGNRSARVRADIDGAAAIIRPVPFERNIVGRKRALSNGDGAAVRIRVIADKGAIPNR